MKLLTQCLASYSLICIISSCAHPKALENTAFKSELSEGSTHEGAQGNLCLGSNFSKAPITGNIYEVEFSNKDVYPWQPKAPSLLNKKIELNRLYSLKIKVNGKLIESIKFRINSDISNTVTLYRSAGHYRIIQNKNDSCTSKTLGYPISKKSGEVLKRKLFCFTYKVKNKKFCSR